MSTIRAKPFPMLLEQSLVGLGARIRGARKARKLSQQDLAELADVGVSTLVSLEAGWHGVSVGNLLKVVAALDRLEEVDTWLVPSADSVMQRYLQQKFGTGSDRG